MDGIPHLISESAGDHLRRLAGAYELVWCTGWEEKANDYLPGILGLGDPLPYLSFERGSRPGGDLHGHWKLAAIEAFAGRDRAVAWIDDRLDDACERWAEGRPGPTLLVRTDSAVGLTAAHVEALLEWALRAGAAEGPGAS